MNNLKSLIRIQAPLIVLEILSIAFIFYFGVRFYSNSYVLKRSDLYEAKNLIVDLLKMSHSGRTKSDHATAFGEIY